MSADAPISLGLERRRLRRIPWIKLAVCLGISAGLGTWMASAVRKARRAAHAATTS